MTDFSHQATRLLAALAALSPFWLVTVAALAWGRVVLDRKDILKALAWTVAASAAAFPIAWAVLRYFAGFNPQPRSHAGETGLVFASLLLPVYSALIACVAFGFVIEAARKRGTPARPLVVRVIAGLVLTVSVIGGFLALGLGALFAAGPKPFG